MDSVIVESKKDFQSIINTIKNNKRIGQEEVTRWINTEAEDIRTNQGNMEI